MQQFNEVWDQFVTSWLELKGTDNKLTFTPDPEWPSPCELKEEGEDCWCPILQSECELNEALGFKNVEQAMQIKINDEYVAFFTLYFSDNLTAKHEFGELEFLQAWSESDFIRLQQNLIGHLMMKQRLKQAPTLFFALTDEEDLNLVINNQTGQVCLEYVGQEPHKVIAPNLTEFIRATKPS